MKFIAEDGTIFDNQKDCETYEENHCFTIHNAVNELRVSIRVYGYDKEVITFNDFNHQSDENWIEDFISCIEWSGCCYFRIGSDEETWKKISDILEEEYDTTVPIHPGLYWRNDDNDWISYEKDKRDFENRWKGLAY